MTATAFVDESKSPLFTFGVVVVPNDRLREVRDAARSLCAPGAERIHFSKDKDSRKHSVLNRLSTLHLEMWTVSCKRTSEIEARSLALQHIAKSNAAFTRMVLELDVTMLQRDRRDLARSLKELGAEHVAYAHSIARADPALWFADAIAWCENRGGMWRSTIRNELHVSNHQV